jgi:DNA-binding response OmpR family regulator
MRSLITVRPEVSVLSSAPSEGHPRLAPHVLVIEPDETVRRKLVRVLVRAGYPTASVAGGVAGLAAVGEGRPDLVVLGPRLPDLAPAELLPRIREVLPRAGAMVVACAAEEPDLVALLDAGADDCCVQPESADMLLARVRAVLRRSREQPERSGTAIRLGGLCIDLAGRNATLEGERLRLSPREFDLLAYLAQRAGRVVSKRELLAEVWHLPYSIADKTIDVHVSWLRRKLNESPQQPRYLHTVRGVGLRLDAPTDG